MLSTFFFKIIYPFNFNFINYDKFKFKLFKFDNFISESQIYLVLSAFKLFLLII